MQTKTAQALLAAVFGGVIAAVGIGQAVVEMARGERPQVLDVALRAPTEVNLRAFEEDLEELSLAAGIVRPPVQYARFSMLEDGGEKGLLGREGWCFYKPGVQYLTEPLPKHALDDVVNAIRSFRDRLEARGIRLLVVPAPGKASVYPEMLTKRAPQVDQPVHAHTLQLMEALKQSGVAVADLFQAFREGKEREEQRLYLAQDTHWSPEGVCLAAKTVARTIVDEGWVDRGTVEYTLRKVALRRQGDVLRMTQAPQIARSRDPELVHCAQVVSAKTGDPYGDDPASEILVLGDSFLRIYERDEPGAAGFIAHLAHELGNPLTSIVNDGGASTLVRQELHRKPELLEGKKLVIWEFVERDIRFGTEGWQDVPLPEPIREPPRGTQSGDMVS